MLVAPCLPPFLGAGCRSVLSDHYLSKEASLRDVIQDSRDRPWTQLHRVATRQECDEGETAPGSKAVTAWVLLVEVLDLLHTYTPRQRRCFTFCAVRTVSTSTTLALQE